MTSRTASCGWALLCLVLTSCSVTGLEELEPSIATNQCDSDSDCGGPPGVCRNRICVAESGAISTLLLEVVPSGNADTAAGEQFLTLIERVPSSGEMRFNLEEVQLSGRVRAAVRTGCDPVFAGVPDEANPAAASLPLRRAADRSIPVNVSFTPSERRLGLSTLSRPFTVQTSGLPERPNTYRFDGSLPAGTYDIYVVPFDPAPGAPNAPPSGTCALAPQLIRGQPIGTNAKSRTEYELSLPVPLKLDLDVRWPATTRVALKGWTADIVEDAGGRVISNRVELNLPANKNDVLIYSVSLAYLPVLEASKYGVTESPARELVRLTPPVGVVAPTVFFDRSALELFSPGHGVIDQLPSFGETVNVAGLVLEGASGAGVPSRLSFVSTELAGAPPGTLTSFSRTVESRDNGSFKVDLLPGTYRVRAVPSSSSSSGVPLASAEALWTIAAEPEEQAGRALQLGPAAVVSGRARLPSGEGALGAIVSADASPWRFTTSTLERELEGEPMLAHASSTTVVESNGEFTIYSDRGVFDFSVRTPAGSLLAWFLRPGFDVAEPGIDLELDARLPLPVPLRVTARLVPQRDGDDRDRPASDPTLGLPGSIVRAYALLDSTGLVTDKIAEARSVLAVAESVLDVASTSTVLVPAALDVSSTTR